MADLDTEEAPEVSSRRDTIEAAFADAEAPAAPIEPAPSEPAAPAPEEGDAPQPAEDKRTAAERARDEAGRFAKGPRSTPKVTIKPALNRPGDPASAPPKPTAAPKPVVATGTPPPAPGEASVALKPPPSWKPAAREKWAALPAEVQQETVRRERETQAALNESAEARKSWGAFQRVVAPYQHMIASEGGDAVASAANLFQTAAQLRTAPAPQRAQLVADIIRSFGVDIGLLDQALVSQGAQGQQPQQAPTPQFKDPRFDELMERLQSGQRQKSVQEVESFGANSEFFEDVRQDMADLLEVASRRGLKLTLEQAYDRACKLHPEVSGVLEQREKAKAATAHVASTQRARAAASSVKSKPAGPPSAPAPSGRRGQLEAAIDSLSRG